MLLHACVPFAPRRQQQQQQQQAEQQQQQAQQGQQQAGRSTLWWSLGALAVVGALTAAAVASGHAGAIKVGVAAPSPGPLCD
jgi:hypothetical protein